MIRNFQICDETTKTEKQRRISYGKNYLIYIFSLNILITFTETSITTLENISLATDFIKTPCRLVRIKKQKLNI